MGGSLSLIYMNDLLYCLNSAQENGGVSPVVTMIKQILTFTDVNCIKTAKFVRWLQLQTVVSRDDPSNTEQPSPDHEPFGVLIKRANILHERFILNLWHCRIITDKDSFALKCIPAQSHWSTNLLMAPWRTISPHTRFNSSKNSFLRCDRTSEKIVLKL